MFDITDLWQMFDIIELWQMFDITDLWQRFKVTPVQTRIIRRHPQQTCENHFFVAFY